MVSGENHLAYPRKFCHVSISPQQRSPCCLSRRVGVRRSKTGFNITKRNHHKRSYLAILRSVPIYLGVSMPNGDFLHKVHKWVPWLLALLQVCTGSERRKPYQSVYSRGGNATYCPEALTLVRPGKAWTTSSNNPASP